MAEQLDNNLSRRERQIMDIVYRRGQATAAEVMQRLPDPPSYSAVRALLRVLEDKGHLRHRQNGARYVFYPTRPRKKAARGALRHVIETFYDGSTEKVIAALLDMSGAHLSQEQLDELARAVERVREEGR